MPVCAACGRASEAGEPRTVRTGVLVDTKTADDGSSRTTTYTYSDMVDHTYFVCEACVQRDKLLRPIVYGVVGAGVILFFALSAILHQGWFYLLALVWLVAGGIVGESLFTLRGTLEKRALAERGAANRMDRRYIAIKPDNKRGWNQPG